MMTRQTLTFCVFPSTSLWMGERFTVKFRGLYDEVDVEVGSSMFQTPCPLRTLNAVSHDYSIYRDFFLPPAELLKCQ